MQFRRLFVFYSILLVSFIVFLTIGFLFTSLKPSTSIIIGFSLIFSLLSFLTLWLFNKKTRNQTSCEIHEIVNASIHKTLIGSYILQNGHIVYANERFYEIFGFSKEFIHSSEFVSTIFFNDQNIFRKENINSYKRIEPYTANLLNSENEKVVLEAYPEFVKFNGQPAIAGSIVDVTNRDILKKKLETNEQYYRSLFDHNPDAVYSMNREGTLVEINPALEELLGYSQEDYDKMTFHPVIHSDYLENTVSHFLKALEGTPQNYYSKVKHRCGRTVDLNITNIPIFVDGEIMGVYGIAKNITNQKIAERKLEQIALTDYLTGLPNRYHFHQHLENTLNKSIENNYSFAVLFIDLDNFKTINDTYGHKIGDYALITFAENLMRSLKKCDFISRIGGDEFLILLDELDRERIGERIEEVVSNLHFPLNISEQEFTLYSSIGISVYPEDGQNADILIKRADMAMYAAKNEGKNNYSYYTSEIDYQATRKLFLENRIKQALDNQEFSLHYQPQFESTSGRLVGVEALLRWKIGSEEIAPNEFIPIAEGLGMIFPIGEWVLAEACSQMKKWFDAGYPEITISVNVSVRQLHSRIFVKSLERILNETSFNASQLELEITESEMLDTEQVSDIIHEIKKIGVKLAIDDFGAGHSSLNIIKETDIDKLKLDKSLLENMIGDTKMEIIVETLINLAENLKMDVVIEGIETLHQSNYFNEKPVIVQGYFYSHPLPSEEFEKKWKNEW